MAVNLRLDWCSYKATKYACEHWHYTGTVPVTKSNRIGIWEDDIFKGCIIFTSGAGASTNGKQFGLRYNFDMVELQRIALDKHITPVSRMVKIAIIMLKKVNPRLRMIVSYSDPREGHHGGVYQAGNWVYVGKTAPIVEYELSDGRWVSKRVVSKHWGRYEKAFYMQTGKTRKTIPKYKYLYPLDAEMKAKIEPLRKPYPKRQKDSSEPSAIHAEEGGAAPTLTLHNSPMEGTPE